MPRHSSRNREKFKTMHNVFDEFTNRNLFKLISRGHFRGLESPIFIGKESNVFSALTEDGRKVMVKIYRLEACDFNRMYDYIKSDVRYTRIKKGRRNIIFMWVQREYRNLLKAREAGVSVPTPIAFLHNIIVLEMIGSTNALAPMLKDRKPKDIRDFFKKIIGNMRKLHKAGLVHADLSGFNILNCDEMPVFIDFSQATSTEDSRAAEFLERDIRNICTLFRKFGFSADEKKAKEKIVRP
ncbi:serine protein kinase RIO [Candidatus Woesearchaeota archaeon]|nr:serine protein kinase RIO [Candidatus Woesearchaeota archaeon]MBI2661292.1 serine protein kinase RIO [Candidatus Woesearchaeota archaeon]